MGESSPGKLHNIVQDMGNETGNQALTISADNFIKAMEQGGITPQEFQASMPDVYAQLQYLAPGESLQILHTDLARNPEVMEHVVPFARAGEGAPNAVEAMAQVNEHFDGLVQKIRAVADERGVGAANNATEYQQRLNRIVKGAERIVVGATPFQHYDQFLRDIGKEESFQVSKQEFDQAMRDAHVPPDALQERLPKFFQKVQRTLPDSSVEISHEMLAQHPELLKYLIPYAKANSKAPSGTQSRNRKQIDRPGNPGNEADTTPESTSGSTGDSERAPDAEPNRPPVHGFESQEAYQKFVTALNDGLSKAGYGDAIPIMHGSSVTGKSFSTGEPLRPDSDLDVALSGENLLVRAQSEGMDLKQEVRAGPLKKKQLEALGLYQLKVELSKLTKRRVDFMIYKNELSAWRRGPSVHIK